MALAKKLYEVGDEVFWKKADLPSGESGQFKVNSLAWFLTDEGKSYVALEKKRQTLSPKMQRAQTKLEKNKIGKDKKIIKKPKNVLQFLGSKHG